jgi:hypothetical protein
VFFLYSLPHRPQLLAHQFIRRGHYKYVRSDPQRYSQKRVWCSAVSIYYLTATLKHILMIECRLAPSIQDGDEGWSATDGRRVIKRSKVKDFYESIRWCWVALALASLVLQATGSDNADDTHKEIIDKGELILTIVFDVEIVIRVIAYLPDWRAFAARGQNWLDLILAIGSTIIQIPVIHNSNVYPWLTIFQLARFYRVILEIPRVKPLLVSIRDLHIIRFAKCSSASSFR